MFRHLLTSLLRALQLGAALVLVLMLVRQETVFDTDIRARVRPYISPVSFDFTEWMLQAMRAKVWQAGVSEQAYVAEAAQAALVREYFEVLGQLDGVEASINQQYSDPAVTNPAEATVGLRAMEADLRAQLYALRPTVEAILQDQLSVILAEQGLAVGGQPVPPVAFHLTPLPYAVIVSPRDEIRVVVNTDVEGELTTEQITTLEDNLARNLDVSALVVPLGGIGTYPTMVLDYNNLPWLTSVIAHEWIHNYLTWHPLGFNYETSGELRTMNETTAELAGNELGALWIARYYPDLVAPPRTFRNLLLRDAPPKPANTPPSFDFQAEMHTTRLRVDALLAEGQVAEAEAYMEARRQMFWEQGYGIRKLNQAYFAFYGAYAASSGGSEGLDPVGPAVRLLRRRSASLADFIYTIATFNDYAAFEVYLGLRGALNR